MYNCLDLSPKEKLLNSTAAERQFSRMLTRWRSSDNVIDDRSRSDFDDRTRGELLWRARETDDSEEGDSSHPEDHPHRSPANRLRNISQRCPLETTKTTQNENYVITLIRDWSGVVGQLLGPFVLASTSTNVHNRFSWSNSSEEFISKMKDQTISLRLCWKK